jgi:hypothetical protein
MAAGDSLNDLFRRFLDGLSGTPPFNAVPTTPLPSASAAALVPWATPAVSGTSTLVSAGWRRLYWYNIQNPNSGPVFVQFFNAATAGAVTPGTTAPLFWIAIPAGGVVDSGYLGVSPAAFPLGIVVAITTTPNGATAPTTACPVSIAGA